MTKKLIVGLTGSIASGKSTISSIFEKYGIPNVDADLVARQVVEPGTTGFIQVTSEFNLDSTDDGSLNRRQLGEIVFSDPNKMAILNKIMQPLIFEESKKQITKLHEIYPIVIYNAALIIEMGMQDLYRPLIVVYCSPEAQKTRLMARNNLTEQQALDRIQAQMPTELKLQYADYVIDTVDSREDTAKQVEKILKELKELIDESRTVTEANNL